MLYNATPRHVEEQRPTSPRGLMPRGRRDVERGNQIPHTRDDLMTNFENLTLTLTLTLSFITHLRLLAE